MCLGALVDLGVPLEYLIAQLQRLGLEEQYQLQAQGVQRQGQAGTQVQVCLPESSPTHGHHRHLPEIEALIRQAGLPPQVSAWSLKIFQTLAQAEAAVHGIPPERVHFHEVGAVDAIVDIVGTCLGLDYLGVEKLYCSALPTGGGTVQAAHGRLAVPVPAVLQLWQSRQVPVYDNGIVAELVTPTGAAIAVSLAEAFGAVPAMTLQKIGLGAGSKDFPIANFLRLWLGESSESFPTPWGQTETIIRLETQLDDLNPQVIGYLFEQLYQQGALEVFTQAIGMKKSRPGILLTVLCLPETQQACQEILFQETTTLGIRVTPQHRLILQREWQTVETPYGPARVKLAYSQGPNRKLLNVQPEFEDCVGLAQSTGRPWQQIYQTVMGVWYSKNN
ncbi:hypothetical protein OLK001_25540 [Synechocystis sp. LKSZ1]